MAPTCSREVTAAMRQIRQYADDRNAGWCVYCGGPEETRDHVPSKVLLDTPYPDNLPVVPACATCNSSFSLDEEYTACLIECAMCGSVQAAVRRPKIAAILARSPGLVGRLRDARRESASGTTHDVETARVERVIVKLARAHVAFEQNEPRLDPPDHVAFAPLCAMSDADRDQFEASRPTDIWPEVGSRAMIRSLTGQDVGANGWVIVQPGRYRYRVNLQGECSAQVVLGEYVAALVIWQ